MIKVNTTRFSDVEVNEEDVITIPSGLIGFPELKRYVLLDHDKDSPFKWFQSLDDGAIAFVLINPLLFKPDYVVEVTEIEIADLTIKNEDDAVISTIVTIPGNPENMTANLKAPLIFNLENRTGKQLILSSKDYTTRHNIMEEVIKQTSSKEAQSVQDAINKAKAAQEDKKETKKQSSAK